MITKKSEERSKSSLQARLRIERASIYIVSLENRRSCIRSVGITMIISRGIPAQLIEPTKHIENRTDIFSSVISSRVYFSSDKSVKRAEKCMSK